MLQPELGSLCDAALCPGQLLHRQGDTRPGLTRRLRSSERPGRVPPALGGRLPALAPRGRSFPLPSTHASCPTGRLKDADRHPVGKTAATPPPPKKCPFQALPTPSAAVLEALWPWISRFFSHSPSSLPQPPPAPHAARLSSCHRLFPPRLCPWLLLFPASPVVRPSCAPGL